MTERELINAISKLPVEFMRKTIHTRPDERGNNLVTIRFWVEEEEKVEGS